MTVHNPSSIKTVRFCYHRGIEGGPMYIVRETFTAKPGKASALARLLKQVMAEMADLKVRVATDYIGPFNTVIVDVETEDLATFDRVMEEYATRTDIHEKMKGYTDMYVTGKREVFRIV
jgi:hypothetical protein